VPALYLLHACLLLTAGLAASAATLSNPTCSFTVGHSGRLLTQLTLPDGERATVTLTPSFARAKACSADVHVRGQQAVIRLLAEGEVTVVRAELLADGIALRVRPETDGWMGFSGTATGSAEPLHAARITLDDRGEPTVHRSGDVLHIGAGKASNRSMNALYSTQTFRGVLLDARDGTPDLRPTAEGHSLSISRGELRIRALDVWPLIGRRPASGYSTYGHPESSQERVVPREWIRDRRPFPWPELSPTQLPLISITDPAHYEQVKTQVDFLAEHLRDWGFYCYGEWPLTQRNPDYAGPSRQEYLEGNRRTCDYAHSRGIKILRWVTDPDIQPSWYPELHREFLDKGWLSVRGEAGEWLPDYTNPGVQNWVEKQYADLAATGPDFYWVDNNHPTPPLHEPDVFPPDAFRQFYLAIRRGLLSTGRDDILIRSGASAWADYSAVGIVDVYAPGPDVQNDWTEQQIYVAAELARRDYLCHYNLWRRCIDDYFPAGPQTIDQTRAMGTLLGLTGLSFTTTDIGLPNIPADRLQMLRRLVPVAHTRPMDLCRFDRGPLPRWWVLNQTDDDGRRWCVAGVLNWGLEAEERHFVDLEDLGLDPHREYLAYDVWSQRPIGRFRGAIGLRVAPTSGPAIALHPVERDPFIIGTDRHVTMGAAELQDIRFADNILSARFVAGVAGRTFHLDVFCPEGREPTRAAVDGLEQPLQRLADGLLRVPVPCNGKLALVEIAMVPTALPQYIAPAPPGTKEAFVPAHAIGATFGSPAEVAALLQRVRSGETVVIESPTLLPAHPAPLWDALDMRWGLFRGPADRDPWRLTVPAAKTEAPDGLLLLTTCIAHAPFTADALLKPLGRGLIAVVRPCDGSPQWRALLAELRSDPAALLDRARSEADDARTRATSTVGPFAVNGDLTRGTATLSISPALADTRLSFHFRRLSPSLISPDRPTPQIEIDVNGRQLEHNYNPCRPESPPQEWDSLYFAIPAGLLKFDGTDTVGITTAHPATDAPAFAFDLENGLELTIETPALAGRTELIPAPRIALLPPVALDAFLGLDGGMRLTSSGRGVDIATLGGKPYNSWPAKPGGTTHCIFDEREFTVVVTVPRGSAGTLEAYAFDHEGYRRQTVTFEDGDAVPVEQFGQGRWLRFAFGTQQSADGRLRLTVSNVQGANCVLSRVRLTVAE